MTYELSPLEIKHRKETADAIAECNRHLKSDVKDEASFRAFNKLIDSFGFGLALKMKRRNYYAQGFTSLPWNADKCHYVITDGISTGRCLWKNLYRVVEVSE
jgi:hypothetical protein